MSSTRVCSWLVVLTCVAVLAGGCKSKSDVTVLKLAHSLDIEHPVHHALMFLAQRVKEKSNGKMRIDVYPTEQLGSERDCIEHVQLGILAMTKTSSGPMEGFVPALRVFGLPYLFRDSENMWKVFEGPIGKELLAAGERKGLKGLCFYDAGARSFYTTHKQIETPADLAGLKIRVLKSEMSMRMIQAMGGSPTPIDWGELYTALQQGVVDGAENNPPSYYTSRHYEITRYFSLDEHLRLPDMLVISPRIWKQLSPEDQKVLTEAVAESVTYQRQLWEKMERKALTEVEKAGVIVTRPDKKPFRDKVQSLWAEFEGTEVGELAKRIQATE